MAGPSTIETTRGQKRENLYALGVTAFLRGAHTSAYNVIWQPFVLSLGASMPTLGLLNSLGGQNGLITTLVQPLGGWLADRVGRKPFLIVSSFAVIGAYALFSAAGLLRLWLLLLLGVAAIGLSWIYQPARNSMTAESAEQLGSAFSAILVAGMIPGIVIPAMAGELADRAGYLSIFALGSAIELVAFFIAWRYIHETQAVDGDSVGWRSTGRAMFRSIVPPKGQGAFFWAVAGDSFVWGIGWGLLYGMLTETYNFSAADLGILASVMYLAWALMQMPIGRYIDHSNVKGLMVLSEALGIPLLLLWLTQSSVVVFAAGQVIFAATAATWSPTISTYLTRSVSAEERAEAFGRLYMFRGLVSFPSTTIGGLLYAWGGFKAPIFVNLIGVLGVIALLVLFLREPKLDSPNDRRGFPV